MDTLWHKFSKNDVAVKFKTSLENGLSSDEVILRQERYGRNELDEKKKESLFLRFIKQFNDFMIIILIIASIISAVVSKMQGENDYIDSIIIIAIVIFNAIMGLVQEEKAEKSIESLKKLHRLWQKL